MRRLLGAGVDVVGAMAGITGGRTAGGEPAEPAAEAVAATGADGYVTGSRAERSPGFAAVRDVVAAFRRLPSGPRHTRGSA